ncbi:MFS transporter [Filobacillus milosensis]|uniref:MFS transporter n=1 Tax=Filobacillus milosensis TaxID=94137 RepID=A0A4Y8IM73_9BACI|nr:MFS transporter [Filobacillus milosensis]TFB18886.1 MFS transporter [Filobacillus milosensis]
MSTQVATTHEIHEKEVSSIFKNKKFLLFVLTFLASSFSVSFFMFTVNWYVVDFLRLEAMLGLVFFASSVPRLMFMLIGGVIADRINRGWIMFLSDFTKGVLLIGVIGLLMFDMLSIWLLIGLALVFGLLDAFFWPASSSMLPTILKKEELTRGNSIVETVRNISIVTGPILAGVIIGFGSYTIMFAIVSGMLLISALVDWILKNKINDEELQDKSANKEKPSSIFSSIKEGLAYLKQSPFLLTLMLTVVFLNLAFAGPLQVGMPIFAKNVLGGDELTFSTLSAGLAIGMLLGTILVGVLNIRKKRGLVAVVSIGGMAIFYTAFSLIGVFWVNVALVVCIGISVSFTNVPLTAAIQHHTEEKYIGRVSSLVQFSAMGLIPISYLITTMFISLGVKIDQIMMYAALTLCVLSAIVLIKAKSLRELD